MKKIILSLILFSGLPAFSATELECYKTYADQIETIDSQIIQTYDDLYDQESELLNQIFSPESYVLRNRHDFVQTAKSNLFSTRSTANLTAKALSFKSMDLSDKLKSCLAEVKK